MKPLEQIDAKAVRAWLGSEAQRRPTHAALAFRLLRAFLRWCAYQEEFSKLVHADACKGSIARDELPKRVIEHKCLQREQLMAWFKNVKALENPLHSAYLQILLLTGARSGEIAGMQWKNIDFKWKSLTIRDKVEEKRVIPLTPYVEGLLLELRKRQDEGGQVNLGLSGAALRKAQERAERVSQWVFGSSAAAAGRMSAPRAAHKEALVAADLPDYTLNDLRRSFITLSEWVEIPSGVVAQIVGHKPSALAERHYRRRPLDMLRMWHTRFEGWVLQEAGIETSPELYPPLPPTQLTSWTMPY